MDEKISLESIARYSEEYTEKVLSDFFSSKDKISGPEILSFSNIQQVNLFVVRELFKTWKEETTRLKSPYFNYDNIEVKEAFEQLMHRLSNNILVDRQHFTPLFKNAVTQTLLVVFDPYDFFSILIAGKNNKLDVGNFKEEIKYLKINKAPLDRLLQKLLADGVTDISGNEGFAVLDQILEEVNFNPEDVDTYLEKFSSVVPLDVSKFYIHKKAEAVVEQNSTKATSNGSERSAEKQQVADQKEQKSNTVYDSFNKETRPSLADNFQKIGKIKDSLTINQKFMFTKVLFHGDFELFSKAIDQLDRQDNMKGALRYIEQEHASTWDRESEEFHEFMELVEKRFA
jgi:hypothetical protein